MRQVKGRFRTALFVDFSNMETQNLSRSGQNVTRSTTCPCFSGRKRILAIEPICWFCRFAAFDLKDDKLPEQGVCHYPEEQNVRKEETP